MTTAQTTSASSARLKLTIRGAVQGVGFRPFAYRLANELGLTGWVNNSPQGVFIEVEGLRVTLEKFRQRLETEKPPRSFIQSREASWLDAVGYDGFVIRESEDCGEKSALVLPDIATCPDCLSEIFDPTNRRFRYPFTNCTNCGPRFSIIESLPYDRASTSMKHFAMCPACEAEYHDPLSRHFHAQPNACHVCGPQLELWPGESRVILGETPRALARGNDALLAAAHVIRCGHIVAVKSIGGFHLFVDARNDEAVRRLRERKHREEKPFALMFPSLQQVKHICEVSPLEERLLQSPEAPIVLLRKRSDGVWECGSNVSNHHSNTPLLQHSISPSVAPRNPNLGVLLPSNPLHHLLMAELNFPVIATSGNLSDEPICTDELDALERLRGIADVFLVHNRPIVRHVDDSIVRVMLDREMILRRARGFAPLPIPIGGTSYTSPKFQNGNSQGLMELVPPNVILAVGAHLKNSVALAVGEQIFLSQHIGDLETEQANHAFRRVAADLPRLYDAQPEIIVADLHPDYLSTRFAEEMGIAPASGAADRALAVGTNANGAGKPGKFSGQSVRREGAPNGSRGGCARRLVRIQHHIAHVLSCLTENEVSIPALGVAWDGTGLGTDGTIGGGEFFRITDDTVERMAHWRPFRLPGGDAAAKEPRRAAVGLLYELFGDAVFQRADLKPIAALADAERAALKTMLARGLNAPWCCSVGRLFDVVASLVGLRQQMRFEGQAAMELEFAAEGIVTDTVYELPMSNGPSPIQLDWARMIEAILADVKRSVNVSEISTKFHNTLAEAIVSIARCVGESRVALSGGCFQNRYLTERAVMRLRAEGFQAYWHQRVPTNDGGIALGQVVAARRLSHAKVATVATDFLTEPKSSQSLRALCEV